MSLQKTPTRRFRCGRYQELKLLGLGAESEVVLALDLIEQRQVVLKWRRHIQGFVGEQDPILDTLRRLTSLGHPGLCVEAECYFDATVGSWVLVEPWVDALDLAAMTKVLSVPELDDVFLDLVHILDYLHATGLRHGDLKPQNVIVPMRGGHRRARLIDFGMTRPCDLAEFPGGTPPYLPPEITKTGPSAQMDWYALGIMLRDLRPLAAEEDSLSRLRDCCLESDPVIRRVAVSEWPRPYRPSRDLEFTLTLADCRQERANLYQRVKSRDLDHQPLVTLISLKGGKGNRRTQLLRRLAFDLRRSEHAVVTIGESPTAREFSELGATACGRQLDSLRKRSEFNQTSDTSSPIPSLLEFLREVRPDRVLFILLGPAAAKGDLAPELVSALEAYRRAANGLEAASVVLVATEELNLNADFNIELPEFDAKEFRELIATTFPTSIESVDRRFDRALGRLIDAVRGNLRTFENTLAESLSQNLVEYRLGRLRIEWGAVVDLAHKMQTDSRETLAIGQPRSPVVIALRANLGHLDRLNLQKVSGLSEDDLSAEFERLREDSIISIGDHPSRVVSLCNSELGDLETDFQWPLSLPFSGSVDKDSRPQKLRDELRLWIDSGASEAAWHHLNRALGNWENADFFADLIEPIIRGLSRSFRAGLAREILGSLQDLPGVLGAKALRLGAELDVAHGKLDEALRQLSRLQIQAEPQTADEGITAECAAGCSVRAYLELIRGGLDQAHSAIEQGLSEEDYWPGVRLKADAKQTARLLTLRAALMTRKGELEAAAADYRDAINYWKSSRQRADLFATQANYALLLERDGDPDLALAEMSQAVLGLEEWGRLDQLAASHANLGAMQDRRGDLQDAAWSHRRAAVLFGLAGDHRRSGASRASVGIAEINFVSLVSSRRQLRDSAAIMGADADPRALSIVAEYRALLAFSLGRRSEAISLVDLAISLGGDVLPAQKLKALGDLKTREPWLALQGSPPEFSLSPDSPIDASTRDPILRGLGFLANIRDALGDDRRQDSQTQWRQLSRQIDIWEQDMSPRQKMLFRSSVANPAFRSLRRELDRLLDDQPPGAGEHTMPFLRRLFATANSAQAWQILLRVALKETPALRAAIIDIQGNRDFEVVAATKGVKENDLSRNFIARLSNAKATLFLADAGSDNLLGFAESVQRLGLLSLGGIPLANDATEPDHRRWLYVDAPIEAGAFDQDTIHHLSALAEMTSLFQNWRRTNSLGSEEGQALREEITSRVEEIARNRERSGSGIIPGRSLKISQLNFLIRKAATSDLDILIIGETGAGKELVAEALHAHSPRRNAPFITVDLSALPATLFERELFGHEAGAFSGAEESHAGLLRLADGGTIFLDGVDELEESLQAKLLRVLETKRIRPIGGTKDREIDLRVLASAKQSLRNSQQFREDLYYRLARLEIEVPPLRDRLEDLDLLLDAFATKRGRSPLRFTAGAWTCLENHNWPGNVRQFGNMVDQLDTFVGDTRQVAVDDLPNWVKDGTQDRPPTIDDAVRKALKDAMKWANGQKSLAAKVLGISRSTLYKKLEEYGEG